MADSTQALWSVISLITFGSIALAAITLFYQIHKIQVRRDVIRSLEQALEARGYSKIRIAHDKPGWTHTAQPLFSIVCVDPKLGQRTGHAAYGNHWFDLHWHDGLSEKESFRRPELNMPTDNNPII